MTQAARVLYMTQPSVSQAISELEREYSTRLFERLNHRLFLTEAGEHLRAYANHIVNLADQAKTELGEIGSAGSIRVGASQTVGAYWMPAVLRLYRQVSPQVELFSLVDNTRVIEHLILEDKIDLGVVEGSITSRFLAEQKLCTDELVIVCGNEHPFFTKPEVRLSDLAGERFLIRESGSGTRDLFELRMKQMGLEWKTAGVYSNTESIKQAVCSSLALAALPKIAISEEEQKGLVKGFAVEGLELARNFNLIFHKQKYFTAAMQQFVSVCNQRAE
jgi:DNA-binding transcriptional LysR family regulator